MSNRDASPDRRWLGPTSPSTPLQADTEAAPSRLRFVEATALLAARIIVGGIFLVAAIPKLQSPSLFADAVRAYHLLPSALVLPFAYALPWIELGVALYLLLGFMPRLAAIGALLLLAMFEYALLNSLFTGDTAHSCGCFGSKEANPLLAFLAGGNTITWWDAIRDALLAALAAAVLFRGAGPLSVQALFKRGEQEDDTGP